MRAKSKGGGTLENTALSASILFIAGGRLFDGMSPKAPFIIVGAVNLLVMLGGMWLRARVREGVRGFR
ncbi:hypothetical protein EST62_08715 [Chlorobaculum sp. 24CR]|uniref:hypothetical protein n=1 Tax=Chlorobaculum sp. 24CR TaxID=2508878 RepID=UPI00100B272B|nr:hypothetical protein [Chlorobaculum sp. 24CR]RXK84770.1 hypothetical protein EST62_08715 [Chlorobaculum sp. 24CR]